MKLKNKNKAKFHLPTEFSEPCTELADYTFWIYGIPGAGKTTLSQMFDDPIHVMTEPGAKALRLKPVYPRRWEQVNPIIDAIEESTEFKTATLDTVEAMYDLAWKWAQKKNGWEHPSDEGYGKGWASVSEPFLKALKRLMNLPDKGCVLISHAKNGTRKLSDGDEVEDVHPNLSGKMLEEVAGAVDVVGYYHTRRGQAVLQIRPTDEVMAKCRLEENFNYEDGGPIRYIPMGTSKQEAYANLLAAFNNELERPAERKVKKPKLKRRR